ncbi:MAG: 2Fe-2S iron-sulfur cluster binding domain-containing protein [Sphingomonadales bacterium]|nr:2Fe-2S iron-sulfur cluster binding domain-containing protein [Sphingomonadales bacterium]
MTALSVEIRLDGQTFLVHVAPQGGILAAAEDAGVDIPTSCRAGSCATCRAKLVAGEVAMATNMALDDEELATGYVLVCQAVAVTAPIVLDFDQE